MFTAKTRQIHPNTAPKIGDQSPHALKNAAGLKRDFLSALTSIQSSNHYNSLRFVENSNLNKFHWHPGCCQPLIYAQNVPRRCGQQNFRGTHGIRKPFQLEQKSSSSTWRCGEEGCECTPSKLERTIAIKSVSRNSQDLPNPENPANPKFAEPGWVFSQLKQIRPKKQHGTACSNENSTSCALDEVHNSSHQQRERVNQSDCWNTGKTWVVMFQRCQNKCFKWLKIKVMNMKEILQGDKQYMCVNIYIYTVHIYVYIDTDVYTL